MLQESDVLSLVLSAGALAFLIWNRHRLVRFPSLSVFTSSLVVFVLARILTVLEGFFWPSSLNLAEHVCYTASTVLLLIWSFRVFAKPAGGPQLADQRSRCAESEIPRLR